MVVGPRFRYQPLDSNTTQIRLLAIRPGQGGDTISCTLRHVYLDEKPQYEALSYSWGDPSQTHEIGIFLHGDLLKVTPNLFAALKYLRQEATETVLWVDALCIDQANVQERSSQVQRMRDIYSHAQRTIVWLGDGTSNSDSAMASIVDIANYGFFDRGRRGGLAVLRTSRYNFPELLKFHGCHSEKLKAVKDLLSRPWFRRMWVVQELSVSKEVIVVCGTSYITWENLSCALAALVHCTEMSESTMTWGHPFDRMAKMDLCRRRNATWRLGGGTATINGLMHDFRDFEASDPRDKVYSMLGLAKDVYRPSSAGNEGARRARDTLAKIDYSKSAATVFKELARYIILHTRSLNLLVTAIHTAPDAPKTLELPSWTPDWSRPFRASCSAKNLYRRYHEARGLARSSHEGLISRASKDGSIDFSSDMSSLFATGIRWAIVEQVYPGSAQDHLLQQSHLSDEIQLLLKIGDEVQNIEEAFTQEAMPHAQGMSRDFNNFRLSLQIFEPLNVLVDRVFVRLIEGDRNFMALASCEVRKGDIVAFLYDQGVPFLLRESRKIEATFLLVGQLVSHYITSKQRTILCRLKWADKVGEYRCMTYDVMNGLEVDRLLSKNPTSEIFHIQ